MTAITTERWWKCRGRMKVCLAKNAPMVVQWWAYHWSSPCCFRELCNVIHRQQAPPYFTKHLSCKMSQPHQSWRSIYVSISYCNAKDMIGGFKTCCLFCFWLGKMSMLPSQISDGFFFTGLGFRQGASLWLSKSQSCDDLVLWRRQKWPRQRMMNGPLGMKGWWDGMVKSGTIMER